jgi:hypothetical protein
MKTVLGAAALLGAASAAFAAPVDVGYTSADIVRGSVSRVLSAQGGGPEAGEAVLYTNNVETGSRFNNGVVTTLAYDDVPIPAARLGGAPQIEITRITMAVRQGAITTPTAMNFYAFTPDSVNGLPPSNPITSLGSFEIPANPGTAFRTVVASIGDGITPLTTLDLNYGFIQGGGFGTVMVGATLGSTDPNIGLRITNGPDANIGTNGYGLLRLNQSPWDPAIDGFGYGFGGTNPPPGTFYIVLEGNPIPEPASLSLLAMGGMALLRRRRD